MSETPSQKINFDLDNKKELQHAAFKLMMYKFFENIYEYPESFYFTEEGKIDSNFWRCKSNKVNNMTNLFHSN